MEGERGKVRLYILVTALFLTLLASCSPEKKEGTIAPPSPGTGVKAALELEIQPLEATRESTFFISSKKLNLSKAKLQWYVNDRPVEGAIAPQFKPVEIKRGDSVYVKALIDNREMTSNRTTVKNIPPSIARSKIVPAVPKAGDILKIDIAGNDRDGDDVTFTYEWSKNGESADTGDSFEGPFKRGDKISVKITPYDGNENGQAIILTSNIHNSPPKPSGSGEGFADNKYSYQMNATDPDGDVPNFALKQAPNGMVIDKSTGLITWNVETKDSGRHPVTVQVTDGQGGEVLYNFDVTLGFERR